MKRTIELSLETAINFYKKGGEFRVLALSAYTEEELTMASLPTSWEEFCKKYPVKRGEVWMGSREEIGIATDNSTIRKYRNWLPSEESAKKHLALMQLEQLRDCYRQGWTPSSRSWASNIVKDTQGNISVDVLSFRYGHFLSFKDVETAKLFAKNFVDLIQEAGDLI